MTTKYLCPNNEINSPLNVKKSSSFLLIFRLMQLQSLKQMNE